MAQIRSFYLSWLLVFLCLAGGCKAQTASGGLDRELTRRISLEIRSRYTVPEHIIITFRNIDFFEARERPAVSTPARMNS